MSVAEGVPARLLRLAAAEPERPLYAFLDDDGAPRQSYTYGSFEAATGALATAMVIFVDEPRRGAQEEELNRSSRSSGCWGCGR